MQSCNSNDIHIAIFKPVADFPSAFVVVWISAMLDIGYSTLDRHMGLSSTDTPQTSIVNTIYMFYQLQFNIQRIWIALPLLRHDYLMPILLYFP